MHHLISWKDGVTSFENQAQSEVKEKTKKV